MSNDIVMENQLPGTPRSVWDVSAVGDTNIEGFATSMSINHGETVSFKIETDAPYTIDIYRLGYYGGDGARLITTIEDLPAQFQPDPIRDAATGLVDAGNWNVSASWTVPSDMTSGVFFAKLTRTDGTGENVIPFIVRADDSNSDIVFQTSDTTWEAYNAWGSLDADGSGASLYGGDAPPDRAYAVSYNRPFITRDNLPWNFVFGPEYSAIYWLEQNGYDVSYIAGADTDRFGSLLLNHDVFLTAGHDEYWSGQQRANVEAARDAGVNLMLWTGNECYWRTRWEDSIDGSGTPYRTLVCYKESFVGDIDPSNEWTGTFRDGRFSSPTALGGGIPENALIGSMFGAGYDPNGSSESTIAVPYEMSQLRFWRDTDVANTQVGQEFSLGQNLLTYEWDISPDNGYRPAGLIPLSSTTVNITTPQIINDFGTASHSGTATHNLTLYRDAESGALVFSAGTVFWSWGLSGDMDVGRATHPEQSIQQAMVNLFADMGVQPETLQSGLVLATASDDFVQPVATVGIQGGATTVVDGQILTILGTATDDDGNPATQDGKVAAIEVSTNGGVDWHVADGTTNWTYEWLAKDEGPHIIMARAIDDSLNTQYFDVASVTVDVVPPGTETVSEEVGTLGSDSLVGHSGQDWMYGSYGVDELIGLEGNDYLFGEGDQDWLYGEQGIDELNGEDGNDFLFGQADQDWLYGGDGDDSLDGGEGNNFLFGGPGDDQLLAGTGIDVLQGDAGNDNFVFRPGTAAGDVIVDFDGKGADDGDQLSFVGFGAGATFTQRDATHWVITYDGGTKTEVITFQNGAAIHASDFHFLP